MQRNWLRGLPLLFALVGVVALFSGRPVTARAAGLTTQQTQAQATPQRFTAFAVNLSGRGTAAQTVDIEIKHWSTDAQRDRLLQVLRDMGEQAMLDALQNMPVVGTIRTPDSLAYDLHYARSQPWDDGGEQVLIATDRYINYWETVTASRTLQYPFTVIQMRVKGNGQGEGRVSLATKVTATGNEVVLENYDSQPILLTSVTREQVGRGSGQSQ